MDSVSLILRPVSAFCNLSCIYCYNENLSSKNKQGPKKIMSSGTLHSVIDKFIASNQFKRITMLWHGGEPFLAGSDFFKEVVSLQKEAIAKRCKGITFRNNIQTNGTILDEKLINFFVEEKFQFGISVDGPDHIHDKNRFYHSGKKTHKDVIKTIRTIKEMGGNVGTVAVVTKMSLGYEKEILEFFLSEKLMNIHFLPYAEVYQTGKTMNNKSISAQEFGEFLLVIFKVWRELDDPKIKIRIFNNFLQGM